MYYLNVMFKKYIEYIISYTMNFIMYYNNNNNILNIEIIYKFVINSLYFFFLSHHWEIRSHMRPN